jgi:hypothetical protein
VAFGPKARALSPLAAGVVDAFHGRGVLLASVAGLAFVLLAARAFRNPRAGAPAKHPGLRPGQWLTRLRSTDLVLAGTFLALLLVLQSRGGRLEVDGPLFFAQLRSVVIDHDLDLTNEFADFVPERYQYWAEEGRRLGVRPNPTVEPGPAILWSPFFLLAHLLVRAAVALGAPVGPADGYAPPYVNAVCLASLVLAYVAAIVAARIARRFVAPGLAAVCAAAAWLASPLLWYSAWEPGMSHAPAAAAVSVLLWRWLRVRDQPERRRHWLLLGLAAGVLVSIQRYDAYVLLGPALEAGRQLFRARGPEGAAARRTLLRSAAAAAVVLALALIPLVYENLVSRHGNLLGESHLVAFTFQNWAHPRVVELLFSSRNGLLSWTPVAGLGIVGLALLGRRDRFLSAAMLVTLAFGVYLLAASYSWSASWSFGSRRLTEAYAFFVLGLALTATALLARPAILGLAGLAGLATWNLLLAGQVRRGEIPRDETFAFSGAAERAARTAYAAVGHLPSAPAPWLFGAWYGVPPDRFDLVVGREPVAALSLDMGTAAAEPYLGRGWAPATIAGDRPVRASEGVDSTVLVNLIGGKDLVLAVRAEPAPSADGRPLTVSVAVNRRPVGTWSLAGGVQEKALRVPASAWSAGVDEIRFDYGGASDAAVAPASDRARAAWRVEELSIRPADGP